MNIINSSSLLMFAFFLFPLFTIIVKEIYMENNGFSRIFYTYSFCPIHVFDLIYTDGSLFIFASSSSRHLSIAV